MKIKREYQIGKNNRRKYIMVNKIFDENSKFHKKWRSKMLLEVVLKTTVEIKE